MIWTTRPRSERAGHMVIATGDGPDILFLHGVGLRAEAWAAQFDALGQCARLTAWDMPGHGEDVTQTLPSNIHGYCEAASAVLSALDGPAMLVGHSMGAMIAINLAQKLPSRVRSVVALNAVFERRPAAASAVRARAAALDGRTPSDPSATLQRWFGNTSSAERDACEHWLTHVKPSAYQRAYTAFAQSDLPRRDMLKELPCPALFVTGSLDPNSTPSMAQAMAALAPQGDAQIIDDAAHMLPMTHPEAVNAALLQQFEVASI